VKGTENLMMMIRTSRHPHDKSELGYQKVETPIIGAKTFSKCSICGKFRNYDYRCYHKKQKLQTSGTNRKGLKIIWVPRNLIVPIADDLNKRKTTSKTVPE